MSIWTRVSKLEVLLKGLVEDFLSNRDKHEHCQECGGVFLKGKMKAIGSFALHRIFQYPSLCYFYYCKAHAPKYDKIVDGEYFIESPNRYVKCDINGKEIKGDK